MYHIHVHFFSYSYEDKCKATLPSSCIMGWMPQHESERKLISTAVCFWLNGVCSRPPLTEQFSMTTSWRRISWIMYKMNVLLKRDKLMTWTEHRSLLFIFFSRAHVRAICRRERWSRHILSVWVWILGDCDEWHSQRNEKLSPTVMALFLPSGKRFFEQQKSVYAGNV